MAVTNMSYCRFAPGDVYIYHNVNGYLCCCACRLTKKKRYQVPTYVMELSRALGKACHKTYSTHQDFNTKLRTDMILHIEDHIKAGHLVTNDPIARLVMEIKMLGNVIH